MSDDRRTIVGPRDVRIGLREGDVLTVARGGANPVLEAPLQAAFREIALLIEKNQPTRGDEWRLQPIEFHVASATAHLGELGKEALAGPPGGDEDHLLHAATRLVMALQLRADAGA